jgi:hypothetical protein
VDGPVAAECLPAPGAVFPVGVTVVTCTARDRAGNQASRTFKVTVAPAPVTKPKELIGAVPATLALDVGPASLGTFVPGVTEEYVGEALVRVTSSAGDATLTVVDPAANARGRLVNGAYALREPLEVSAGAAFAPVTTPATLRSYDAPVSVDPVTVRFRQQIGAKEPLRTGKYSKVLTFTLTTTSP